MTKCNYGQDMDIDSYNSDNYSLGSSDYDSDDDCGYVDGKRTKRSIGKISLKLKVRELVRNNYEESDSDEYVRWEKQKKRNKIAK